MTRKSIVDSCFCNKKIIILVHCALSSCGIVRWTKVMDLLFIIILPFRWRCSVSFLALLQSCGGRIEWPIWAVSYLPLTLSLCIHFYRFQDDYSYEHGQSPPLPRVSVFSLRSRMNSTCHPSLWASIGLSSTISPSINSSWPTRPGRLVTLHYLFVFQLILISAIPISELVTASARVDAKPA